jgi:hypothetical protein
MLTLRARTNKGSQTISCPESWHEVTVEKYQRILREWDNDDWVQLFSILTDLEADSIANSTDGQMEGALYQSVQFVFTDFNWDGLKIPAKLKLQTLLAKDSPLIIDEVRIKNIGRMSIGQNIQARKSLEGMKDIREGLSIVTEVKV